MFCPINSVAKRMGSTHKEDKHTYTLSYHIGGQENKQYCHPSHCAHPNQLVQEVEGQHNLWRQHLNIYYIIFSWTLPEMVLTRLR